MIEVPLTATTSIRSREEGGWIYNFESMGYKIKLLVPDESRSVTLPMNGVEPYRLMTILRSSVFAITDTANDLVCRVYAGDDIFEIRGRRQDVVNLIWGS